MWAETKMGKSVFSLIIFQRSRNGKMESPTKSQHRKEEKG
jgi:hypothetical protein